MTNIEKIRQEIERRKAHFNKEATKYQYRHIDYANNCFGARDALRDLLAFIDSLSEEKPSEDLEEAVFKEWGTTKEEYLAKSMDKVHLEMEITTYLQDWDDDDEIGLHLSTGNGSIPIELEDIRDLARHFANWQKKQMMKEAVEGLICATITGTDAISFLSPLPKELTAGDKVHIIIVKEEKK